VTVLPEDPLPPGWSWALMQDIAEIELGKMLDRAKRTKGTLLPYLRNINVRWGHVDTADLLEMPFEDHEFERYSVKPGDLVVCEGGEPGRAAIWSGPGEIRYQKALHRVRAHPGLWYDPRWIVYHLRLEASTGRKLARHFTGTTIKHLTRKAFRSYPIRFAPVNEQRRIVDKIEALNARSRRAREALEQIPPLLERFRQSVLAAAFRGDLTAEWRQQNPEVEPASVLLERIRAERRRRWEEDYLAKQRAKGKEPKDDKWKAKYPEPEEPDVSDLPALPKGWKWTSFGEAFDVQVGATPRRNRPDFWDGDLPWVSSGEVGFCRIAATRESISQLGLESTSTALHPPGTVLLGMIGEGKTRGQAAILDVAACNNQNSAAIRVSESGLPPEYVYFYLRYVYEQTRRRGSGNSQPALNKSRVRAIRWPCPPFEEMRAVLQAIDARFASRNLLRSVAEGALEQFARLDQSILTRAFRGELVPQDPNDEPASVLLDRIRAERAQEAAKKQPPKAKAKRRAKGGLPKNSGDKRPKSTAGDNGRSPAPANGAPGNGAVSLPSVLAALKREPLHRIADAHDVELSDRRSLDGARKGILEAELGLEAILEPLKRDELKAICRALDLDDSGRAKAEIRARILAARGVCGS